MKIDLNEEEIRALMSCIAITDDSISNNVLMATMNDQRNLRKVNLDDLYIKISDAQIKKGVNHE